MLNAERFQDQSFLAEVNALSGQTIQLCYHCHKCTGGCPTVEAMEYGPDRILRMAQMGERDLLLKSRDIWLCASCETCGTRCPNEIDIAQVMDALRSLAVSTKAAIPEARAVKFHRLFLEVVKQVGRSHEAVLLAGYKVWTLDLLSDMDSGVKMLMKGKVPLLPRSLKARREVRRLFDEAAKSTLIKREPGSEGSQSSGRENIHKKDNTLSG